MFIVLCVSDKREFVFEMISTDQSIEVSDHEDENLINIENAEERPSTLQGIIIFIIYLLSIKVY